MNKNKKTRTRIAPSPTGYATIGNIRTALFCYLYAKKHGGDFVLRIEDTDKSRFVPDAEKYIIDSLKWLGITPDDGINSDGTAKYRQSEREYKPYADLLISNGHAYYAFDTKEDIEKLRADLTASGASNLGYNCLSRDKMKNSFTLSVDEVKSRIDSGNPYVIRFNTPRNKEVKFLDSIKGWVAFNSNDLDDKVLFKSDGMVAYHLANVVDDHLMAITHVIRGEEWVSSTPLHIMLYEAFGWEMPEFCHLPLVLGPDGKKLSKRKMKEYGFPVFPLSCSYKDDNDVVVDVVGFKDEDYEPDALINFLTLLGWNPGGEQEIMSIKEMISLFDLTKVNNAGAKFDIEKLKNFNAQYMRSVNNDMLFSSMVPNMKLNDGGTFLMPYSIKNNRKIIDIAKERSSFRKDLYATVSYFYEPVVLEENFVFKNPTEFSKVMEAFLMNFPPTVDWTAGSIKDSLELFCIACGCKMGSIMPGLRVALTGGIPGPHLPETMEILGKDESFKRIKNLLGKMKTELTYEGQVQN